MRMRSKSEFVHRIIRSISFMLVVFTFPVVVLSGSGEEEAVILSLIGIGLAPVPILISWFFFWMRDSKIRVRSKTKSVNRFVDIITVLIMIIYGLSGDFSFSEWLGVNVLFVGWVNIFMGMMYFIVDGYRLEKVKKGTTQE